MSKRKTTRTRKLHLSKSTVRQLADEQLSQVEGAGTKNCYLTVTCVCVKTNR